MGKPLPQRVRVYRVGGSVRDELLGRSGSDTDWVVVGATPEMMVASGYRPVGRDFPVFLHPDTNDEYALARTERKQGVGYRGFAFFASPEVTLESDLARRDLTINAMARADDGVLIDPYGGARDLAAGVLRHVSPAFADDPLRVLRVARFAARFGFKVAPKTKALLRALVASGELATLVPERVWQELATGVSEARPSLMFAVLRECGALAALLPEVDALFHGPESDGGAQVMQALDFAAQRGYGLAVRYAVLAQDLRRADSRRDKRLAPQRHPGVSVHRVERMSERLRVPIDCRDLARLAARWHASVQRAQELQPAKWLELLMAADALRRPQRLGELVAVCECVAMSRLDAPSSFQPGVLVREAHAVVRGVDGSAIATEVMSRATQPGSTAGSEAIAKAIRAARLAALRRWRVARKN